MQIVEGGGLYQVTQWGNSWHSALEMPSFRGPIAGPYALASSQVVFNGTGSVGGYCSLNASCFNVQSVYKNAVGNYTINFQKSLSDNVYAVLGSFAGIGFFSTWVTLETAVTVQLFNSSGNAADINYISVVTFGSNDLIRGM